MIYACALILRECMKSLGRCYMPTQVELIRIMLSCIAYSVDQLASSEGSRDGQNTVGLNIIDTLGWFFWFSHRNIVYCLCYNLVSQLEYARMEPSRMTLVSNVKIGFKVCLCYLMRMACGYLAS